MVGLNKMIDNEVKMDKTIGNALKLISKRLQDFKKSVYIEEDITKDYGCLVCRHFQREESYDQQRGVFAFFISKCKKRPNVNMVDFNNRYSILDINPNFNPNFYYENYKGKCPYFKKGNNELIYFQKKDIHKHI